MARRKAKWDATSVKALRQHLNLTQEQLARELGARQQTVSEWETGAYQPRGISERLLGMIAERADFAYGESPVAAEASPESGPADEAGLMRGGREGGADAGAAGTEKPPDEADARAGGMGASPSSEAGPSA